MRWFLSNLPVPLEDEGSAPARLCGTAFRLPPGDFREVRIERRSIDARHKGAIRLLLSFSFESKHALNGISLPSGARLEPAPDQTSFTVATVPQPPRVVVVGTGPAGIFCALRLLDYGITPVVVERGPAMGERVAKVNALWQEGRLDPDANAQFGEGGAGTFSDGKLATRIGHPAIRHVLETFVRHGAAPTILVDAKPHVGTEVIRACAVRMRRTAEAKGAAFRFGTRVVDLRTLGDTVTAAVLESGEEIPCEALVLAPGHSARDTFEMLARRGVALRQKGFAMGLRVEHPQDLIDRAQYGASAGHPALGAADYRLVANLGPNRAAYSFCMCPGGMVIQASSEEGGVVVNGMSRAARDSGFANSGLVAKVNPSDFGGDDALAGMRLQRVWERAAFETAGRRYGAPAMGVQDFMKDRASGRLPATSFRPFAVPADLKDCLPDFVRSQLLEALPIFERKLRGFTSQEALFLALESRTSSPVQIPRREDGQSVSHTGLYPCGEGAGFAGGITSAAVDGVRVAEWIAARAGAAPFEPFFKEKKIESPD